LRPKHAYLAEEACPRSRARSLPPSKSGSPVGTSSKKFPNFREALNFVNSVGELAEVKGHHPDIFLTWGKVDITTWTHKINGLTESDFILAAKIDKLYKP